MSDIGRSPRCDVLKYTALMRLCLIALAALVASCGSAPAPAVTVSASKPKPTDESRRLPKTNLVDSKVVDKELMGKPFMPGGTVAHYKNGKTEYEIFVSKLANPQEAAFLL